VQSVKKLLMLTQRKGVKYVYPKREQLDLLIANVEKTIAAAERRAEMTDKENLKVSNKK